MHGYWQTTKHPWPCLLFVLPLLAFYEGSMIYQAMEGLQPYRCGLDSWMHTMLVRVQWHAAYAPSLVIAIICVSWAVILWDRSPPENLSTLAGMFLECIVFSLAMWGLGALVTSQLAHLSISQRTIQAVSLLGSGLFEEVLFRLVGFGLLLWLLKWVVAERTALMVALLISSVGFAAAHHLGPHGEAWQLSPFVFRSLAGLIFASIFHYRGLGIAVGTHSAYNVVVGLLA